jgi:3-oxoacyl-[acyl-carrier protein] reductase
MTKVVLITGSSKGIGAVIAKNLASKGMNVVINYNSDEKSANEIVKSIGTNAISIKANIGIIEECNFLIEETIKKYGKIDYLINNAGIMKNKSLEDITEKDFDDQFNINVKGTLFLIKFAVNNNVKKIINFSSSTTSMMLPNYSVYTATKGAIEQITKQLAKELGNKGITVNAVSPGPTDTELFRHGKSEQVIKFFENQSPLGRLGKPEDISDVVEFLLSDQAKWINGQTIKVNGGIIA